MTELDIMKHAKGYLDNMVQGNNPLTGEIIPDGEVLRQDRISRCLSFVSDVLGRVIDNGGQIVSKEGPHRTLSPEILQCFPFSETPMTVSAITKALNEIAEERHLSPVKLQAITTYLIQTGLLQDEVSPRGEKRRLPTAAGRAAGLSTEERIGTLGAYSVVLYGIRAQHFIVEHIEEIMTIHLMPSTGKKYNPPWTPEQNLIVADAFRAGQPIPAIAEQVGRTPSAVESRLAYLGLLSREASNNPIPQAP